MLDTKRPSQGSPTEQAVTIASTPEASLLAPPAPLLSVHHCVRFECPSQNWWLCYEVEGHTGCLRLRREESSASFHMDMCT